MSDKQRPNNGDNTQKPNFPDQTRGNSSSSAPVKPQAPKPPSQQTSKPKN